MSHYPIQNILEAQQRAMPASSEATQERLGKPTTTAL
jgi:hypothetical protein